MTSSTRQINKRAQIQKKMESNESPEIPDRGETSEMSVLSGRRQSSDIEKLARIALDKEAGYSCNDPAMMIMSIRLTSVQRYEFPLVVDYAKRTAQFCKTGDTDNDVQWTVVHGSPGGERQRKRHRWTGQRQSHQHWN